MRCLIDTNILISAVLFPNSVPAQAFIKAVAPPHTALISDFCLAEMKRVYERKFPHKLPEFEQFIKLILPTIEYVLTPIDPVTSSIQAEQNIRDINDRPVYRAAIAAKADIIITGDRDLLEADITCPQIITAVTFLSK